MTHTLGAGLGFKPEFAEDALASRDPGLWFEVHPENYLVAGGPRLALLETLRARHPVSLHGVSMSLGGAAPPDPDHLRRLAALADRLQPALVSEHLAWSRFGGAYAPDLLPVPRTTQALRHVAANLSRMQDALRRRVAIENPTHYLTLAHEWGEVDFLHELVRRTGCGLLVDVNNVFVSASNLGLDADRWIDAIDGDAVMEIHVAGHRADSDAGTGLLIDSHDDAVAAPVWVLLDRLTARIGPRPTLIERDGNLPPFADLIAERERAQSLLDVRARVGLEVAA
ncbi:MNIO family bufferin maturase [Roseateles chitinivorans]|uniref:MNIO family bufferin maturase n=1 Tax=Roseateles chitinivorans TaxID=2917965 RepID=UPI003D678540